MSLSPAFFGELPLDQQLPLVWTHGSFLAARLVKQRIRTLYQLHYDFTGRRVAAIHCYATTRGLDDYLDWVQQAQAGTSGRVLGKAGPVVLGPQQYQAGDGFQLQAGLAGLGACLTMLALVKRLVQKSHY